MKPWAPFTSIALNRAMPVPDRERKPLRRFLFHVCLLVTLAAGSVRAQDSRDDMGLPAWARGSSDDLGLPTWGTSSQPSSASGHASRTGATSSGPGVPSTPEQSSEPESIPIDGGLSLLAACGAAYAVRRLRKGGRKHDSGTR